MGNSLTIGTVNALMVYICKHFFSNVKLLIAALYFLPPLPKPACKTYEIFLGLSHIYLHHCSSTRSK